VQTLAKVYEDRAAECSRAAQQTDDPVFRRLLLMLASQWKLAAQEEAPPWTSTSGGASGLPNRNNAGARAARCKCVKSDLAWPFDHR
jgi:hypothetical protein